MILKDFLKGIVRFCEDTFEFILFLNILLASIILGWTRLPSPIKRKYSGTVAVLANGPSLKEVIPLLTRDDAFKNVDFMVMNFFAFDDVFFEIKPKHYCFLDIAFYKESDCISDVQKLFAIMQEKIDWALNIYVSGDYYSKFLKFSGLTNKNINIIGINTVPYRGYLHFRNFFFAKGLSVPPMNNVSIPAIFVSINCGYSTIMLYGVDHNFTDGLFVDENNQPCNKITHFYEKGITKPIMSTFLNRVVTISEFFEYSMKIFASHEMLSKYAESLNVNILNCTKDSFIDAYKRVPFEIHNDLIVGNENA